MGTPAFAGSHCGWCGSVFNLHLANKEKRAFTGEPRRMKRIVLKKWQIVAIVAAFVLLVWAWLDAVGFNHRYDSTILHTHMMLENFILAHDRLPDSKQELIDKGFLRHIEEAAYVGYEVNFTEDYWCLTPFFGDLKIAYGVSLSTLTLTNDKLYDQTSKQLIYLIDGPRKFPCWTGAAYMRLSVSLYNNLSRQSQHREN